MNGFQFVIAKLVKLNYHIFYILFFRQLFKEKKKDYKCCVDLVCSWTYSFFFFACNEQRSK